MDKPNLFSAEELLEIGRNERWNEAPGWQESIWHHLAEFEKVRKIKLTGLVGGVLLVGMCFLGIIFGIANWQNGQDFFPVVSLVLFTAFFAWQTRMILSAIFKINELTEQLKRVGINYDVYIYHASGGTRFSNEVRGSYMKKRGES